MLHNFKLHSQQFIQKGLYKLNHQSPLNEAKMKKIGFVGKRKTLILMAEVRKLIINFLLKVERGTILSE